MKSDNLKHQKEHPRRPMDHYNLQFLHSTMAITFLNNLRFSPWFPSKPQSKGIRFDGSIVDMFQLGKMENGDVVVETSITRTLPAALTFWCGLESIKEALEELKLNPPSSSHGIIRFQERNISVLVLLFLGEMVVETSITRTLPAALTFWCGLESIKEALEELKLNPPSSSH
ncbi:protein PHYLLO, chloroplastic-like [Carica papaya]|uniref:protein PHYLLO, chloroplastic-like n=1 Tax=Carica papaya TaxID=3649 RepID=UPI000B8C82E3|nr:protein PHYLLO, chloroplastic-like [Carica papaya]XP_021899436.1 protein PHYLLO, chloroplastic-like [Carica papaya]XP_021899444.1 protein PHYLLO, chloroplastic-like [Carica papaya]